VNSHARRPKTLWLLLGLPALFLLVVLALDSIWGGGHPSLSAVVLYWGVYPTLTGYLSRALLGSEFLSPLMLAGLLEYLLVVVGFASIAKSQGRTVPRSMMVAFLLYVSAQFAAHLVFNLQSVNLRLMADSNRAVSNAAVDRIRASGDAAAVPALQQKLVEDFERQRNLEAGLLDALTVLGGARGWQNLLDGGRLGVAGRGAVAWRFVAENVRAMANPLFAEARGGVKSPDFREQDMRASSMHSPSNWWNGCRLPPTAKRR
jgi:hypothetical protein